MFNLAFSCCTLWSEERTPVLPLMHQLNSCDEMVGMRRPRVQPWGVIASHLKCTVANRGLLLSHDITPSHRRRVHIDMSHCEKVTCVPFEGGARSRYNFELHLLMRRCIIAPSTQK